MFKQNQQTLSALALVIAATMGSVLAAAPPLREETRKKAASGCASLNTSCSAAADAQGWVMAAEAAGQESASAQSSRPVSLSAPPGFVCSFTPRF